MAIAGLIVLATDVGASNTIPDVVAMIGPKLTENDCFNALKAALMDHFDLNDWDIDLDTPIPIWKGNSKLPTWPELPNFIKTEFIIGVDGSNYLIELKKTYAY